MRILFFVSMTALLLSACQPAQTPQAASPAPAAAAQAEFKPVADIRQLMTAIVIPTSDALFDVGSKPPKDEKAWAAVEHAAVTLAESGNLLMIGDRAKNETEWKNFSRALIDGGQLAIAAAKRKDVDEVLAAGDTIYSTCENCHNKYMDKSRG